MFGYANLIVIISLITVNHRVRSGNPEGGTGCSRKPGDAGWCWRYCRGSSGYWCYTANNCGDTEQVCASSANCTGTCLSNSSPGCVNACVDHDAVDYGSSPLAELSVKDALETIAVELNVIQDKLNIRIPSTQETQSPDFLLKLGRIGYKIYYRSLGLKLNWAEALNFCHLNGLQLASIESSTEQQALESFLTGDKLNDASTTPEMQFWAAGIWITDVQSKGTNFYWVNNGRQFGYTNWDVGQPDNPGGTAAYSEHCLEIWKNNKKWNNRECTFRSPVICEEDARLTGRPKHISV